VVPEDFGSRGEAICQPLGTGIVSGRRATIRGPLSLVQKERKPRLTSAVRRLAGH